uniref:Uncharacterized protein n=1 Tax=Arundo donax TaxID=35708 RepID=A0A0A9HP42_ARUDO
MTGHTLQQNTEVSSSKLKSKHRIAMQHDD